MMNEDLPACCGKHNYQPGGGSMGGNGSTQWHTCEECGRACIEISNFMTVFVMSSAPPVRAKGTHAFPKEGFDYLNGTLDVTMRAYGAEVETVRKAADLADWNLSLDLLGLPRGTKIMWKEPTDPSASGRYMQRPDGTAVEDPSILQRFDQMSDARRQYVANGRLVYPITPPKVPACLTVWVRIDKGWHLVDHAYSATLEIPRDPRRIFHDTFFDGIFGRLRAAYNIPTPTEIPNRYDPELSASEPWFTFGFGTQTYTIGPRKRVYSITVESAGRLDYPFSTRTLREAAKRDAVTYYADNEGQSDAKEAKKITIHAYGGDKLLEYLSLALEDEIARSVPRRVPGGPLVQS